MAKSPGSLEKGRGSILQFNLTAEQLAEGGLICGGNIDIFIEPLTGASLEIYEEIRRIKQKGGSAILATLVSVDGDVPQGEESKALIKPSGEKMGSLLGGKELEEEIRGNIEVLLKEKKPNLVTR